MYVFLFLTPELIPISEQSTCFEINSGAPEDVELDIHIVYYKQAYDTIYVSCV